MRYSTCVVVGVVMFVFEVADDVRRGAGWWGGVGEGLRLCVCVCV